MKNTLAILGISIFLVAHVHAQSLFEAKNYWDNYTIRTLSMEDGMPGEQVYFTLEDSLGFIWIANINGLVRYDGLSLRTFDKGYKGGTLYEIYLKENGNFLIPSIGQGVYEFNGKSLIQHKEILPSDSYLIKSMVHLKNGHSVFGMYGDGLAYFDGENVTKHLTKEDGLIHDEIWKIIEDKDGRLWVGTNHGLSIIDGESLTNFTTENGLPYSTIRGLTEMPNGDIWVGTDKEGIVIFRDQQPIEYIHTKDGLSGLFPQYFALNPIDSSIWIAHHGNGLDVYRNGKIENLTSKDGLISDYLTFIGFSKDGTAYIGHETGMSVIYPKLAHTITDEYPGIHQTSIVTVNEDGHGITWLGSDGNGFNFKSAGSKTWNSIEYPSQLTNGYASTSAVDRNGNIWFSTQGTGVIEIVDSSINRKFSTANGLINDFARGMDFDQENNLWIGTNQGVNIIYLDSGNIDTLTTADGLSNNFSMAMYSDSKGNMWHGSYGGGVTRINNQSFTVFDTTNGLGSNFVLNIHEDPSGRLLIGTGTRGISYYKNGEMHHFDHRHGFPIGNISGMDTDLNGMLWCATNNGIFTFDPAQLDEIINGDRSTISYQQLSQEDGLSSLVYETGNGKTVSALSNGELIFASLNGVDVVNPQNISFNSESFFPYVDEFIVDDSQIDFDTSIKLTPEQKKISINYSALNIEAPKKTAFRIRLDGIDEEWIYVGNRRTAYYDYLPDGEYTFHVSAIGPDGQWSNKTASIDFTVLPPFYKTWWFIGLCLLGFVGMGAGGVYWRSNQKLQALNRELETQHKIQQERERISRELHDNVGSQISNLITGIEISNLHVKNNQQNKALSLLDNLDSDARGAMTDLRETIWLLDKEKVEFGIFLDHLNGYLKRQKRYLKNLKVMVESTVDPQYVLSPDRSLNLTRIVQEALNNTNKYANASLFSISCSQSNNRLRIVLKDDGVGMDSEAEIGSGNGLVNLQERAKMMNASILIESKKGKGTTIALEFS